jgi:hypothetical protein
MESELKGEAEVLREILVLVFLTTDPTNIAMASHTGIIIFITTALTNLSQVIIDVRKYQQSQK